MLMRIAKAKIRERYLQSFHAPEYGFGHLDQPGESGGGADAWNADASLLPPSAAGTFFPGGAERHKTACP
jgi:hypothetical protein